MSKKDTIYIDVEDDITAIIDKLRASKAPIVALVLPKRSSVLRSVVNMKLLKKAADETKKKPVLITNESSLLPLAGTVGLYVAKTLETKPEIPDVPKQQAEDETVIEDGDAVLDADKAIGDLDTEHTEETGTNEKSATDKDGDDPKAVKKASKLKVPNFESFRLRVVLAVGALFLLIIGWFVAFSILPSAQVLIRAQTTSVDTDFDFTANVDATEVDQATKVLPAESKELNKTVTESFTATGEKDVGQKATGTMTVANCDSSNAISIPAGTTFTDNTTSLTFTSDSALSVPGGTFSGGGCSAPGEASVGVTATDGGEDKNLSPRSYSVSGQGSLVTAQGGQMSGGTTQIAKVVSQADVDGALAKLRDRDNEAVKAELAAQFDENTLPIQASFMVETISETAEPPVDTEANEGVVTAQYTYIMLGVSRDDFTQLVEAQQQEGIDTSEQSVYNNGIDDASYQLLEKRSNGDMTFSFQTRGFIGPSFDTEALAEEISGKRFSEALALLEAKPGVNSVDINFSPFYVNTAPKAGKIAIELDVSEVEQ